jgi:hypothetical protein
VDGIRLALDRKEWQAAVDTAMSVMASYNSEHFVSD